MLHFSVGESTAEVLRIIGNGNAVAGARETVEVYRQLWAQGYRPGVPLTFFMRQWAKKKGPRRAPKVSAMAAQYNPEQEGKGSVDH